MLDPDVSICFPRHTCLTSTVSRPLSCRLRRQFGCEGLTTDKKIDLPLAFATHSLWSGQSQLSGGKGGQTRQPLQSTFVIPKLPSTASSLFPVKKKKVDALGPPFAVHPPTHFANDPYAKSERQETQAWLWGSSQVPSCV